METRPSGGSDSRAHAWRHLLIAALCLFVGRPAFGSAGTGALQFGVSLGGSQLDRVNAVATDANGNIYAAGQTYSVDFLGGSNSSGTRQQTSDAFAVKLDSSARSVIYNVSIGGSGSDSITAIAVDSSGNAYVAGTTTSSNFRVTSGVFQPSTASAGLEEGFIAKLDASGNLVHATYLGGRGSDWITGIAVDSEGAVYVAGYTNSVNFPTTGSAPQNSLAGQTDCFVTKLNRTLSALIYSTYLGGESYDTCAGIAVDSSGAAYVAGGTTSSRFPVSAALKSSIGGSMDASLTKISANGDAFVFSTYLGGTGLEQANAVVTDSSGTVYVGGATTSTALPVTDGVVQSANKGGYDGFLYRITGDGSGILFATYLGGSDTDTVTGVAVSSAGYVGITGYTASNDFPMANAEQSSFGGSHDAFLSVLAADGTKTIVSTYVGGGGDDRATGVAALNANNFVTGGLAVSGSVSYLVNRFSSPPGGQYDGFVAAVSLAAGLRFVPITPCRVVDTRNAEGPFGGPVLAAGATRDFIIPEGGCGIPTTAQAYSMNVGVVPTTLLSYVTIWPAGQTRPAVSNLNSPDGRVKSAAAIVPAGTGGSIAVYATHQTHLILDINGYFIPPSDSSGLAYYPITPCRLADTRDADGLLGGPGLVGGASRTFPLISSSCGLPDTAKAYALNFAAVPSTAPGYITAWPTGISRPTVATLNTPTAAVLANMAVVPAGNGGAIDVYATRNTHLVIDIYGYFAAPGADGLSFYSVTPCRTLDSRLGAGEPLYPGVATSAEIANTCGIAASAKAFVLNATVVPSAGRGYLRLWPQGQSMPAASTLNASEGAVTNNLAIVPTENGSIAAYTAGLSSTHLILDAFGYFAP